MISINGFHSINKYFDSIVDGRDSNNEIVLDCIPVWIQKSMALVAIFLLSPLILFVMLLIVVESRGAPFYSQIRVGHHGRRFKIFKFRSMFTKQDPRYIDQSKIKSDRDGICQKSFQDPRITKVGRVIRKLSIDELPQLWNVVKGDMALIGPRPALPEEVAQYDYRALNRLNVIPGLTGLWQVSGRADTTFSEQIDLDLLYVNDRSLGMDIMILLRTIPAVITGKGAY